MTPVVIHLPNIMHAALEGAQEAVKMAHKHAQAVSKRADKTQDPEDHLAAIKAFQGVTEAHGTVAALTGHIIASLDDEAEDDDGYDGCNDPDCPNNKLN